MGHAAKAWCYTTNNTGAHLGCMLPDRSEMQVESFFLSAHPGVRGVQTKYTLKDTDWHLAKIPPRIRPARNE
jgi:hypothetical protein